MPAAGPAGPTGFNQQNWRWLVVTDPELRAAVADIYRRAELPFLDYMEPAIDLSDDQTRRVASSSRYLGDHLHRVPVHVIPCTLEPVHAEYGTFESLGYDTDLWNMAASAVYGELWPASWSFMLALRSRGLGSSLTMIHLGGEPEVSRLLGIPEGVSQGGLIPVAYFTGEDLPVADRRDLQEVAYLDRWGEPLG